MKNLTGKIPHGISDYIMKVFQEDFLFEVRKIHHMADGKKIYFIEVAKDNQIYSLTFNELGILIDEDVTDAFPPEVDEGYSYANIPD